MSSLKRALRSGLVEAPIQIGLGIEPPRGAVLLGERPPEPRGLRRPLTWREVENAAQVYLCDLVAGEPPRLEWLPGHVVSEKDFRGDVRPVIPPTKTGAHFYVKLDRGGGPSLVRQLDELLIPE